MSAFLCGDNWNVDSSSLCAGPSHFSFLVCIDTDKASLLTETLFQTSTELSLDTNKA